MSKFSDNIVLDLSWLSRSSDPRCTEPVGCKGARIRLESSQQDSRRDRPVALGQRKSQR